MAYSADSAAHNPSASAHTCTDSVRRTSTDRDNDTVSPGVATTADPLSECPKGVQGNTLPACKLHRTHTFSTTLPRTCKRLPLTSNVQVLTQFAHDVDKASTSHTAQEPAFGKSWTNPASPTTEKSIMHRTVRILVLFSGPADTPDRIDILLRSHGATDVVMVDLENRHLKHMDLSADQTWEHWLSELHTFHFVVLEPVCGSFSPARRHSLSSYDHGP